MPVVGMPADRTRLLADLSRIRRQTLAEAAAELDALIEPERYSPGDAFPSERVLATSLGVSRTVIRDAVRTESMTTHMEQAERVSAAAPPLGERRPLHDADA